MKTINGIEYMTIQDIADMFTVTAQTVYNWKRSGKIKPVNPSMIGGEYLFKQEDIRQLMAQ